MVVSVSPFHVMFEGFMLCFMFEPTSPVTDMAELSADTETEESSEPGVECAVCLQTSIYPVQLPCGHVFCFLCVKGFTTQSKRCAMCRREVPEDFIQNPDLLPKVNLHAVTERAFQVRQLRSSIFFGGEILSHF